jgi:outer membrane protein assembly factor BamB
MRRFLLAAVAVTSIAAAENWPRFRGPSGQGMSSETRLPVQWDESTVAWKTAIPGLGRSSPIVWGDRLFVTTATEEGKACHILALDRRSGKILWDIEVFRQDVSMRRKQNSFATPTPVTDGKRVYAIFAGGGMAAVDFAGKLAWTNRDVTYYSEHGLGASPVLYKDLLIMPFDPSTTGENRRLGWQIPWEESFLFAVDTTTGKRHWKTMRGTSRIGHVTPNLLVENGIAQLISGAGDVVQGYDPYTGERIWTAYSQGEGVVPSIVLGDGLIFTSSGFEKSTIRTYKTGGRGDVTNTHVAWEQTKGVPHIPSFLYLKPNLYALHEGGVLRAATGEVVWQERVGGAYWSSPVYADRRIYLLDEECQTTIIQPGDKLEIIGKNPLAGRCQASMAVSGGQLFIRSDTQIYAIGKSR